MDARALVCWLLEAANLDKAPVGIEIELGLRLGMDRARLAEFLEDRGFDWVNDNSIEMRPKSLEVYYTDFELKSAEPMRWSVLKEGLEQILAFLKRVDLTEVQRSDRPLYAQAVTPVFPGEKRRKFTSPTKIIRLPRAIVPSTFTAATHLHFDHTWFESAAHAKMFVESFNKMSAELPKFLPAARYTDLPGKDLGTSRGTFYAALSPIPTAGTRAVGSARRYLSQLSTHREVNRYNALNVMAVESRGDVEFRFPHSTMNIATISGWFQTVAEMIDYAARLRHPGDWDDFEGHLALEDPKTAEFLRVARRRAASSRDPLSIARGPSKAVARLLRNPKNVSPSTSRVNYIDRDVLLQALNHEPEVERVKTWIDRLQTIIDLNMAAPRDLEAIRRRISELSAASPSTPLPREEESLMCIPHFQRKLVLRFGDRSNLVIYRQANERYSFAGALKGWASNRAELELMLRDVVADRGGIQRYWAD